MNLCRETLALLVRHRVLSMSEVAAKLHQSEDKVRNALGSLVLRAKVRSEWIEGANRKHYSITDLGREALAKPLRRHRPSRAVVAPVNSVFQLGERA